jgi:hypothetical protein
MKQRNKKIKEVKLEFLLSFVIKIYGKMSHGTHTYKTTKPPISHEA